MAKRRNTQDSVIMRIKEIIIVEGRDDTAAVKKKCGCRHNRNTWIWYNKENLGTYRKGIRRERHHNLYRSGSRRKADREKLTERFPDAGQAFLDRSDATKDGDIGIENASPDGIRAALSMAQMHTGKRQCGRGAVRSGHDKVRPDRTGGFCL